MFGVSKLSVSILVAGFCLTACTPTTIPITLPGYTGPGGGGLSAATPGSCTGNGDGNAALPSVSGNNVISMSIGTGLCASVAANVPCASVTICQPGSTVNCQTINNLLVDTGSYGLRIFSSAITVPLTQYTYSGYTVAECMYFGSATTFGPVMLADVTMGGEPPISNLPIQVINSSFLGASWLCGYGSSIAPIASPAQAGFNGILGVGLGTNDCPACASESNYVYFAYLTGSWYQMTLDAADQVTNPVSKLPVDNNGVIFELPSISPNGQAAVTGNLVLGIDTEANNASSGTSNLFMANINFFFNTTWAGFTDSESFIDSGSNNLYFYPASQTTFAGDDSYNPSSNLCLSAIMQSASGTGNSNQSALSFNLTNADSAIASVGRGAFNDTGGISSNMAIFDWGLPFFYGRSVYVGITGKSSSLGVGPLWAF